MAGAAGVTGGHASETSVQRPVAPARGRAQLQLCLQPLGVALIADRAARVSLPERRGGSGGHRRQAVVARELLFQPRRMIVTGRQVLAAQQGVNASRKRRVWLTRQR